MEETMDELEKKAPETTDQVKNEVQSVVQQGSDSAAQGNSTSYSQNAGSGPDGGYSAQGNSYGQYQDPYGQQAYGPSGAYQQPYPQQPYPQQQPASGLATASMILGIISIPLGLFFSIGGIICAIIGLVLASMAKKRGNQSGVRTAGFICSIIGLILSIILLIFTIVVLVMAFSIAGSIIGGGLDFLGNGGLNNIIHNYGGSRGNGSLNDLNNILDQLNNGLNSLR